ncbi:MAG TPA: energy transducer TonB [Allosphingosinicella sp.]|jgi:TonB family protein
MLASVLAFVLTQAQPAPAPAAGPVHRPPRQIAGSFSNADYPPDAMAAEIQGDVRVRLSVDAAGRVAGCDVIESSANASLDAAACALIRERFLFEPGLDEEGRVVAATVNRRVTWRLPVFRPDPFISSVAVFIGDVRAGRLVGCRKEDGAGALLPDPRNECQNRLSQDLSWVDRPETVVTLRHVVALHVPPGARFTVPPAWGDSLYRGQADVTRGQGGHEFVCFQRSLASDSRVVSARRLGGVSVCQMWRGGFYGPPRSGEPRRGYVTVGTYVVRIPPPGA